MTHLEEYIKMFCFTGTALAEDICAFKSFIAFYFLKVNCH